jgi:hypothetical protein
MAITISKTAELKGVVASAKNPLEVVKAVAHVPVTPHAVVDRPRATFQREVAPSWDDPDEPEVPFTSAGGDAE